MFPSILQAAVLALTLSLDGFTVAFAYGCKKIQMPAISAHIINAICTSIIALSFLLGTVLEPFISSTVAIWLSFSILLIIGISKLLDSITKSIIRKHTNLDKEIKLCLFNFKFIFRVYADPEVVDVDVSESISPKEAMILAISVSLDGFAVGFSAALLGFNGWAVVLFSLLFNFLALRLGIFSGNAVAKRLPFNISWSSGIVLIGLAMFQLF